MSGGYRRTVQQEVPMTGRESVVYPSRDNGPTRYSAVHNPASYHSTPFGSRDSLTSHEKPSGARATRSSTLAYGVSGTRRHRQGSNKKGLWIGLGVFLVVAAAVAIPVGVVYGRKDSNANGSSNRNAQQAAVVSSAGAPLAAASTGVASAVPSAAASSAASYTLLQGAATGCAGSTIYPTNGSSNTFIYNNPLGGCWSAIPGDFSARAQDDTPALNETWDYSQNRVRGMNLGGWFVLEPFICSYMFEPFFDQAVPPVDEYTLMQAYDAQSPTAKATAMEAHYNTFITEDDFANIVAVGFNWIRIPIGYWAVETEPEDGGVYYTGQMPHILRALEWARKYGLRVQIDQHGLPGSQNGWDHSGRRTFDMGMMRGPMGYANAQRSLNFARAWAEFSMRPQYAPIIGQLGLVNEILLQTDSNGAGAPAVRSYYSEAYSVIRNITGTAGPHIIFHDGFSPITSWPGFMTGADRVILDTHPYLSFEPQNDNPMKAKQYQACSFGAPLRNSSQNWGITMGGEWSMAVNDCSYLLNGVGLGVRYNGTYPTAATSTYPYVGSCQPWDNFQSWNASLKADFQLLTLAWMDALQHSMFWTWKVAATASGMQRNPMWSYHTGLQYGYAPTNIRNASGTCNSIFGAGTVPADVTEILPVSPSVVLSAFPGTGILGVTMTNSYTPTNTPFAVPNYTPTAFPSGMAAAAISSLQNPPQPTPAPGPWYGPISGRVYPGQYDGSSINPLTASFTGV